jgi:Skp family chaperone for outer membrane proteins
MAESGDQDGGRIDCGMGFPAVQVKVDAMGEIWEALRMKAIGFMLGISLLVPVWAEGQDAGAVRIAVVDMTQLFNEHAETKAAEARVTKARDAARKIFREKSEGLKRVLQEHQEMIAAGKVEAGREALEKARVIEREIAAMKTTQARDLEEAFLRERRAILESIRGAVKAFNEKAGYHLILDRSAAAASGIPMVVDVKGLEDITGPVQRAMKP